MPTSKRKHVISSGDTFALPLIDRSFVLGQVARAAGRDVVVTALFAHCSADLESLRETAATQDLSTPFGLFSHSKAHLDSGRWPLFGERKVSYANVELAQTISVGTSVGATLNDKWSTASAAQFSAEVFFGIAPATDADVGLWLPPYDVRHFHTRDINSFEPSELADLDTLRREYVIAGKHLEKKPSVKGKFLRVSYSYEGVGLPSLEQLRRRHDLEMSLLDVLSRTGKVQLVGAGGGGGSMDIQIRVPDAARAIPIATSLLEPLKLPDLLVVQL